MGIGRMCGCCAGMNPLRLAALAASPFCFAKRGGRLFPFRVAKKGGVCLAYGEPGDGF